MNVLKIACTSPWTALDNTTSFYQCAAWNAHVVFVLYPVDMVHDIYRICWFENIELSLHPWVESHLTHYEQSFWHVTEFDLLVFCCWYFISFIFLKDADLSFCLPLVCLSFSLSLLSLSVNLILVLESCWPHKMNLK